MSKPFDEFFDGLSPDERDSLAKKADTSVAYLKQICSGHRNAGVDIIMRLIQADTRITFDMFAALRSRAS